MAGKTPAARAAELVAGTKLGDPAIRKALFAGGKAAIEASTDPFIALARLVDPRARELRTKYDNDVLGVERDAYARIAQAVFATAGRRGLSRRHVHAAAVVRPGEGLHWRTARW